MTKERVGLWLVDAWLVASAIVFAFEPRWPNVSDPFEWALACLAYTASAAVVGLVVGMIAAVVSKRAAWPAFVVGCVGQLVFLSGLAIARGLTVAT